MAGAFQESAFEFDAFQMDTGVVPPVIPPSGGGWVRPRIPVLLGGRKQQHTILATFLLRVEWHAELESNDDDLAIRLLL